VTKWSHEFQLIHTAEEVNMVLTFDAQHLKGREVLKDFWCSVALYSPYPLRLMFFFDYRDSVPDNFWVVHRYTRTFVSSSQTWQTSWQKIRKFTFKELSTQTLSNTFTATHRRPTNHISLQFLSSSDMKTESREAIKTNIQTVIKIFICTLFCSHSVCIYIIFFLLPMLAYLFTAI